MINFDKTIRKYKCKTTLVSLSLIATIAFSALLLPTISALEPTRYPSWIYISAAPTPVGVGQQVLFVVWTQATPPITPEDPILVPTGRPTWVGITITLTKPDGTKQTLQLPATDPIGGTWYSYTPTAVGTYSVQANFPGTWKNSSTFQTYYEPAVSATKQFIVTNEQLQYWPPASLPTTYWTRPIDAGLREWSAVAGNWLADGMGNPYTAGPETAHIIWTKPIFFGGIAGGDFGPFSYHTGSAYEAKWGDPVIMQGRLYYNIPLSDSTTTSHRKFVCVDLRTGEQMWEVNKTTVSMGMLFQYESPNQHGVHPYLWGAGNIVYDPYSGTPLFTVTNIPSGTAAVGPNGERLVYQWNLNAGWLAEWNFSAIPSMTLGTSGTNLWQWRPVGKVHNGSLGYSWNVTIPKDLGPRGGRDIVRVVYTADGIPEMILCSSGFMDRWITTDPYKVYAISLKEGQQGQLLWKKSYNAPFTNATIDPGYGMVIDPVNRVFALPIMQTMEWYGYDLDSGNPLWGPTDPQPDYDMYRMYPTQTAVDGKFYAGAYGGILHAYDTKTGNLLWKTPTKECGLEGPYENWPMYSEPVVVDGKVYVTTDEHSHTQPIFRDWRLYCIDAETGKHIWNITGLFPSTALADGYMVSCNAMDNQIYVFGKGPTATSVSIAPEVSARGSQVLMKGSVIDISPGAIESSMAARFPSGVPAIADQYMTEWMECVYKQQSAPTNIAGVSVHLTAIDPNGNFQDIGTVACNELGNYAQAWTPPVPGLYTVTAKFEGSKSYYQSVAGASFIVSEAPSASPQVVSPTPTATQPPVTPVPSTTVQPVSPSPTQVVNPPSSAEATTTYIAIGAAVIVIVAVAAVLILRKRK